MASLLKGFFGEPGDFYEEGAPAYPDHTEAVREARPYKDLLFEESGRPWEGEYVVRRMPSQELGVCLGHRSHWKLSHHLHTHARVSAARAIAAWLCVWSLVTLAEKQKRDDRSLARGWTRGRLRVSSVCRVCVLRVCVSCVCFVSGFSASCAAPLFEASPPGSAGKDALPEMQPTRARERNTSL